ncbi:MAG: hypothetical protein HFI59_03800 [Lachnospiraceae bacterium]|nr:hypothetical protein [Lachnospiraceae bacterium]
MRRNKRMPGNGDGGRTMGHRNGRSAYVPGRDILGYLLLGVSVVLLGRSLVLCFSNDIWYDELFTVGMIGHSYGELVGLTARDVHPPLYYMITKFFVDLCKLILPGVHAVAVAKIVSVLPYFVLLFYSVTFIRKRFGIFTGCVFLFCVVAMPQLSGYTVEVRMYSWALLFVTAAFLHGYGAVQGPEDKEDCHHGRPSAAAYGAVDMPKGEKAGGSDRTKGMRQKISAQSQKLHGAAMACYALAAAYTQYFAAVAAAMVFLYVLLELLRRDRRRIREWFLWVAAAAAGYTPWLVALYRQVTAVNANYWILPLSWRTFGGCVKFLMKPAFTNDTLNVVLAVVMTGIYAAVMVRQVHFLIKSCHNGRENGAASSRIVFMLAGPGVLAGVILFGFAASMLLRPVFVYRYMIPAMGCFWLSFAAGLHEIWPAGIPEAGAEGRGGFFKMLPAAALLFVVVVGLRDYRAFMGEEEYKIRLMKETETALSSIAPGDVVIYNFDQVQAVTAYYLPEETDSYLWCGTPETLIQDIIRPFGTVEETDALRKWCEDGRTVWFFGSFNSRDDIVEEWTAKGLQVEETGSCLLERYWFNLYKISV